VDAYGISQVTPGGTGIHLSWSGPRSWVYAPGGWTVRRRLADRVVARDCERLDAVAIAELRTVRERQLGFGALTLRPGGWLSALDGSGPPADATPTEVFRLDLDAEHRLVRIVVTAKLSWAAAFCEGRVVGQVSQTKVPTNNAIIPPSSKLLSGTGRRRPMAALMAAGSSRWLGGAPESACTIIGPGRCCRGGQD